VCTAEAVCSTTTANFARLSLVSSLLAAYSVGPVPLSLIQPKSSSLLSQSPIRGPVAASVSVAYVAWDCDMHMDQIYIGLGCDTDRGLCTARHSCTHRQGCVCRWF
jgi:hypothetical protein